MTTLSHTGDATTCGICISIAADESLYDCHQFIIFGHACRCWCKGSVGYCQSPTLTVHAGLQVNLPRRREKTTAQLSLFAGRYNNQANQMIAALLYLKRIGWDGLTEQRRQMQMVDGCELVARIQLQQQPVMCSSWAMKSAKMERENTCNKCITSEQLCFPASHFATRTRCYLWNLIPNLRSNFLLLLLLLLFFLGERGHS